MAVSVTPSSKIYSVEPLYIDSSSQLLFSADVYGKFWHTLEFQHKGLTIVETEPFELDVGVSSGYTYSLTEEQRTLILTRMCNMKNAEISVVLRTFSNKSADNLVGLPSSVRSFFYTSSKTSAPNIDGFSYMDTSGEVVSITGDNQVVIQGVSELRITIEGALALNGAEIIGYRVTCPGKTMFSTSPVIDFGRVDCCGDVVFYVTVVDTRGYSKTAQKNISVVEYVSPKVSLTLNRNEANTALIMADISVTVSSAGGYNSFVSLEKREKKLNSDSWSEWTIFSTDLSFTGQLYYYSDKIAGEIEVRASDMFTHATESDKVYPSYPNVILERDYIKVYGSLLVNGFDVMGYKGFVFSGFNNYTATGFYKCDGSILSDSPEESEGVLEVIGVGQVIVQRFYSISGHFYWRMCSDNIWTAWIN